MRKALIASAFLLIVTGFSACKRDSAGQKIIEGIPINADENIVPGRAVQQFHILIRDSMFVIVAMINRLALVDVPFPEITGPDGQSRYTFPINNSHFNPVTVYMQFRDGSNAVIDPISDRVSTSTVKSVSFTFSGTSDLFSFSLVDGVVTLDTAGVMSSKKTVTGTVVFNGQSYSINLTMPSTGMSTTFQGLYAGIVAGTGAGPNGAAFSCALTYDTDHGLNGPMTWEDRSGGIRFIDIGTGFVTVNGERFLLN